MCFKQWNTFWNYYLYWCEKVANMRIKIDKFKVSLKIGKTWIYIQSSIFSLGLCRAENAKDITGEQAEPSSREMSVPCFFAK